MNIRSNIPLSTNELIVGVLLFIIAAVAVAQSRWSRLHNEKGIHSDTPTHIYLEELTPLPELKTMLVDSGLVETEEQFSWAANLLGWNNFREGHYLVDRGFTYDSFLSKLAKGIQDPVSVTILPGRSKSKIVQSVANRMQFDSLSFDNALSDSLILRKYDILEEDVLGRLYPNTYMLFWTTSPEKAFERILSEFDKAVTDQYQERVDEVGYSLNEIITLASIVEWEAKTEDEQSTISGLYLNRLKRDMPLQADPTINYAIGERRRLLYEDYRIDHPYNTYQYRGLPPGPITNPSLKAIEATLYPEDHDYLYMVASPDGSHDFSKTFEEHKRKSAKWRKWLREQYRIKEQREQNSQ